MNIEFLEGREKVPMVCEIEKNDHRSHLYLPKIMRLCLGKKLKNLDSHEGLPRRRFLHIGGPESK